MNVVLLQNSGSVAKVSLLVVILKLLLSYTLFRIGSDLYKKAISFLLIS